jgi:L-seryl-tRNA(Ser) seleniumtransferase
MVADVEQLSPGGTDPRTPQGKPDAEATASGVPRAEGARGTDSARGTEAGETEGGAARRGAGSRRIPRTDVLLADPRIVSAERRLGRPLVKAAIARAQERARSGDIPADPDRVADEAVREIPPVAASLTPIINATGVIVHTNLGRAPLSPAAVEAIAAAAGNCDVEFDLASGARGPRGTGALAALRAAVPLAEAVGVVNNNAAALALAATALAGGREPGMPDEIIISRGELIEIGDRFRLPDLLESTGARLREVGTTNRTTVGDYEAAVSARTAFILKVHPSNYRIEGFTAGARVRDLAAVGREHGVPVVHDIGSGLLAPLPLLPGEPDATTSLADGASLVTASGDKLLGGPQAGLLLGAEPLVRRLLRHPLARALRVDKLTLAALEATLAGPASPVTRSLAAGQASLFSRAERILTSALPHPSPGAGATAASGGTGVPAWPASGSPSAAGVMDDAGRVTGAGGIDRAGSVRVVSSQAAAGGGGAPGVTLPSAALSLPAALAGPLRWSEPVRHGEVPAVVGRIERGRLLLDLRSVDPGDDDRLTAAIRAAFASLPAAALTSPPPVTPSPAAAPLPPDQG